MVIDDISYDNSAKNESEQEPAPLHRLASPMDRLAATMADTILFSPVLAVLIAPFRRQILESELSGNDEAFTSALVSAVLVGVLVFLTYQVAFLVLWGATPGKRILGLRVQYMWDPKKKIAPMTAFIRATAWMVEACILFIPFAAVFGNEWRRPFHDRMADTFVVSLRRTRAVGSPNLNEMAMASGVTAAFLTAFAVVFFATIFRSHNRSEKEVSTDLEDHGVLCASVGDGYRQWIPGKGETTPSRLSVAIAMFGAGSIDDDCLRSEAKYSLWQSEKSVDVHSSDRAEAYLAKAAAESQNRDLYEEYLQKVCEVAPTGDACRVTALLDTRKNQAADSEDDEDDAVTKELKASISLETVVDSIQPSSQPYLKIWTLRYLVQTKRFERALSLLHFISPQKSLGVFVAAERAKALWLANRESESGVALEAALDTASESDRVELSKWFCGKQLAESNCAQRPSSACEVFEAAVQHSERWLKDDSVTATYLRSASCSSDFTERLSKIDGKVEGQSAKDYIRALQIISKKDLVAGKDALIEIARSSEDAFGVEAQLTLMDLAQNDSDLKFLTEKWMKSEASLEDRSRLGRKLVERFSALGSWSQAMTVGEKLVEIEPLDQRLARKLVVAAFRSGRVSLAKSLFEKTNADLNSIGLLSRGSSGDRKPASTDGYDAIVREFSGGLQK